MLRARLVGGLGWWMGEVLWVMVRQWALVTAWNERRAAQSCGEHDCAYMGLGVEAIRALPCHGILGQFIFMYLKIVLRV